MSRPRRCSVCQRRASAVRLRPGAVVCEACQRRGELIDAVDVAVDRGRVLRLGAYDDGRGRRILIALHDASAAAVAGFGVQHAPDIRAALERLEAARGVGGSDLGRTQLREPAEGQTFTDASQT